MNTATKPRKLTTTERRAKDYCDDLRRYDGSTILVEWKRSAMYGMNPVIESAHGKCTNVSGCGYCKLSTALAECLRFLGETPEQVMAIWRTAGAGVSSVESALAAIGWKLEGIASSRTSDHYRLTRMA